MVRYEYPERIWGVTASITEAIQQIWSQAERGIGAFSDQFHWSIDPDTKEEEETQFHACTIETTHR